MYVMSSRRAVSVSRVRNSVRNSWSTETPWRYNLVAASGIPRVTVTNPDSPTHDVSFATSGARPARISHTDSASSARASTWPTVVSARVTFEELNAGQSTTENATSPTAATTIDTTIASAI